MGKPNGTAALFAIRLRKEIARRGYTVRGFGRACDPEHPERGRRRLQRHLSGLTMPSQASREMYAVALEMHPDSFLDEDEERDMNSPLTRATLRQELARMVRT